MKAKSVKGKHEETTVDFTIRVAGTRKAVFQFGLFLDAPWAFIDHGVDATVIRSELVTKRKETLL